MAYEAEDLSTAPETPRDAGPWLDMLAEGKRCDEKYHSKCDNIDKLYANLERQASESANVDREFAIFWANLEVLKPSIYARPPVPVVVPRFKDRKELPRKASDLLERSLVSSFEADDIDATMRLARDDLAINARGVIWLRYAANEDGSEQKVFKEHIDRKDFRHGPARKWAEVPWVARRTWMGRRKGVKRFGDVFLEAEFKDKHEGREDYQGDKEAEVWELWHKEQGVVVWVSPGMDEVLDIRNARDVLDLEGFFPCPRPAYGTLKRSSLTPVPDFVYYKDQVEEINELTARISSLSESLRLKGFYPAGASDVGDAIETVLKDQSNNATLVPINNLALFGNGAGSLKDSVIWLPVRDVAEVITRLVELRKQLISDVYEITGLSDIMRGSTEASETATAQKIKANYGSVRIRDKQQELVRLARDVTRIEAEIMAENFTPQTLLNMSQMQDELPTAQAIAVQIAQVQQQVQQAAADPTVRAKAQQNPQQAQQMLQAANQHVQALQATVTLEKVVELLRSQKTRPFVLEIETDSTIQPDEDAAKQRATEFITATTAFMDKAVQAVSAVPQMAPLASEMLKYVASQFRAGRQLEGAIDQFADQMKEVAQQPKGPTPEQIKAQSDAQKAQQDAAKTQADAQRAVMESKLAMAELALERSKAESADRLEAMRITLDKYKADLGAATALDVAEISAGQANDADALEATLEASLHVSDQAHERAMTESEHQHQQTMQAADHQNAVRVAAAKPQPAGAA